MKFRNHHLFTPGPTPVPEFIARKMSEPIIHHRKPEFRKIFQAVREGLKYVFQTEQEVIVLSSSGTGAMEAAVSNLFSAEDEVITVDAGKFGARWAEICQTYGIKPAVIQKNWGEAVVADEIIAKLKTCPQAKAVFLTYSETSTGVAIDLPGIARAIRNNSDALIIVDCISALISLPLKMDEWQLDVVISGSQKGFMLPPGLAFIALSKRALGMLEQSQIPNYYLSLTKAFEALKAGNTPFTPASTIIIGLREAIYYLTDKGLEQIWREHQVFAAAIRAAIQALGLKLLSRSPSNALTAVCIPENLNGAKLLDTLQNNFGIVVAGGQGKFKHRLFRIGHIGFYNALDIISFIAALEWSLELNNWPFEKGAGLLTGHKTLARLFMPN